MSSPSVLASRLQHAWRKRCSRFRYGGSLTFLLIVLVSAGICILPLVPMERAVPAGNTATHDIVARRSVVYEDTAKTEELRKRAMADVAPIYRFDSTILDSSLNNFEGVAAKVLAVRKQDLPTDQASQRIASYLKTGVGGTTKYLATCSESEVQSAKTAAREALTVVMGRGVLAGSITAARESINSELKQYKISENQIKAAYLLAAPFVVANLNYDQEATLAAREKAASAVAPIISTITAGTIVVKTGTVVDQATAQLLVNTGLVWGQRALRNIVSAILVVVLAWGSIAVAVCLSNTGLQKQQRLLLETAVIGEVCLIVEQLTSSVMTMLTPFLLALLLGFVFFDQDVAIVFGLGLLAVIGLVVPLSVQVQAGLLIGSIAVFLVMRRFKRASAVLLAGPAGGILSAVAYAAFAAMNAQRLAMVALTAVYLVAGGALSAVFALGLTFIFERMFNVATMMRLRELLDTGNKLLEQLFESAPGTYHHSLNVANLAGGAAQRIGANWLLARVGGYYHDIGKLLHPQFFGENRGELPNIHEDIPPELSTKVILEHVQAGVTIATSNRLPREVVDIIAEHHGTTVVQFFYDKAAAEQANLSPDAFRYQGPKPRSRESSLVFLADGVEAAARSLTHVDRQTLEALIENIIGSRIADGQLSDSQLTLGEIAIVKEYFLTSLVSFYHVRDAYATIEEANERG